MTRFFRTAFAETLAYTGLALIATGATGVETPLLSFACLLLGLLIVLLPEALPKLSDKRPLLIVLGIAAALLGLLPLLVLQTPVIHYVCYGAAVLFGAFFLRILRHETTYNNFKARFGFITVVLVIVIAYLLLFSSASFRDTGTRRDGALFSMESVKTAMGGLFAHVIVLLATGVLCLRGLRAQQGAVNEQAFLKRQVRDAVVFVTVTGLVFSAVPLYRIIWNYLLNSVVAPGAQAIARLIESVVSGALKPSGGEPMTPSATAAPMQEVPTATTPPGNPGGIVGALTEVAGPPVGEPKSGVWIRIAIAAVILGALIAVAAVILVKTLRRLKKYDRGYPNETREELPETEQPKKAEKPARYSADPRKRMRYLYADFLKRVRKEAPAERMQDPDAAQSDWGGNDPSALARWKTELSGIPDASSIAGRQVLMQERYKNELSSRMMRHFDRQSNKKRRRADVPKAYDTSTCGEIRAREEERKRAERLDLSEFTKLYEKARYQLSEEPKNEDAARMKALYEEIRKSY